MRRSRPTFYAPTLASSSLFSTFTILNCSAYMPVFTSTLTFYPLPQERKQLQADSDFADDRPANPAAGFKRDGGFFSLSANGVGGEGRGEVARDFAPAGDVKKVSNLSCIFRRFGQ